MTIDTIFDIWSYVYIMIYTYILYLFDVELWNLEKACLILT